MIADVKSSVKGLKGRIDFFWKVLEYRKSWVRG